VTVCEPGTSNCQEITDILLDTGTVGLRIFKQVVSVSLTSVNVATGTLGECQQYADGSSDWGPVEVASVILGNEPAVQVPIQIIDSSFGTVPNQCGNTDASPADAGFNGLLGVGPFAQDCGLGCVEYPDNNAYYACTGSTCVGTAVALSSQVQNPVALLPMDNNGVLVQLPPVPADGAPSVNGSLILGIGTQSNNVPSGVSTYDIDPSLVVITTTFEGTAYGGFLDTGSNALFFPDPEGQLAPQCQDSFGDWWFCPSSATPLSATNAGVSNSASGVVSFTISSFTDFYNSDNNVSAQVGGPATADQGFDWGLPFHFGRNVYVGIEGMSSSLGQGPFWAY
jgi:hypothetical protein